MYRTNHLSAEPRTAMPPIAWSGFELGMPLTTRESRLHRDGPRLERRARDAGVPITYLGFSELFGDARGYSGPGTDWVIGPAQLGDAVIPRDQRAKLAALVTADVDFPLIYVAHEIPKGRLAITDSQRGLHDQRRVQPVTLDQDAATRAIGPVPPPAGATATARRVGRSSKHLLSALGRALPVAAAIVAAPVLLAGAAVGALAAGLDPIVFGAIPVDSPAPGQLATWYVLASWDWPET